MAATDGSRGGISSDSENSSSESSSSSFFVFFGRFDEGFDFWGVISYFRFFLGVEVLEAKMVSAASNDSKASKRFWVGTFGEWGLGLGEGVWCRLGRGGGGVEGGGVVARGGTGGGMLATLAVLVLKRRPLPAVTVIKPSESSAADVVVVVVFVDFAEDVFCSPQ